MRRSRKAKIIATLGPSSHSYERIKTLYQEGADVFRLNFSHGTHTDHQQVYHFIRQIEKEIESPLTVIADLQGPKIRIGDFEEGSVFLKEGQLFILDKNPTPGTVERVYLPHSELFHSLVPSSHLLLDDGKIRLCIQEVSSTNIKTIVRVGGGLSSRKGVNVPDVCLPLSALTDKDKKDLEFALHLGVDWIALSFVQRPQDVLEAKILIEGRAQLIAKIEKPEALIHLDEIIDLSDAIMVARGDLGVEMAPEDVPVIQKKIIRHCREMGKPVIVATQMLDSMVRAPSPTRAEVSDVATAIYDAADAIMLSAESASGQYPIEAITIMDRIIKQVENDPFYASTSQLCRPSIREVADNTVTAAARQIAQTIPIKAIVTFTEKGITPLLEARERPKSLIIALTPNQKVARMMGLFWGTYAVVSPQITCFEEMIANACETVLKTNIANQGDHIIILAGVPFSRKKGTNILHVVELDSLNKDI